MAITYTWYINTLERETATGKVKAVQYSVSATDGVYVSDASGTTALTGEVTIPYFELTPEICTLWVQNSLAEQLPAEDEMGVPITLEERRLNVVNQVETKLAAQVNEQSAPTHALGTPW